MKSALTLSSVIVLEKTKIPSCNFLFRPGIRAKKYPYLYKDERVEKFQKEVIAKLEEQKAFSSLLFFDKEQIWLNVNFIFNFKNRFTLRDTSNMLKATEDALVSYIQIDDSKYLSVSGKKQKIDSVEESIEITIEVFGDRVCACGCGKVTPIATHTRKDRGYIKDQPLEYIPGHNSNGGVPFLTAPGVHERSVKSRTGKESLESPFIPGKYVCFVKTHNRWYLSGNSKNGGGKTHAKAVWEHYFGEVPEGNHVHHKNGKTIDIYDDRPENLMLLPHMWNMRIFPVLAACFNISEEDVTAVYIDLGGQPVEGVLQKMCAILVQRFG